MNNKRLVISFIIIVFLPVLFIHGQNTNYGTGSGYAGNYNTSIGYYAGSTLEGVDNTFLGHYSGRFTEYGEANLFAGYMSGYNNYEGMYNVFLGYRAGVLSDNASSNTFVGSSAGAYTTYGSSNVFLGGMAGYSNTTGGNNVYIGLSAGYNSTGSSNVFIGKFAGYNETGSHKLYIANTSTSEPLIYGEFDNNLLAVHGKLGIGTTTPEAGLQIGQGVVNQGIIFRGLILDGGWSDTDTRSQNLITFKATDNVNSDPFDDTSGESLKNFHIGIVTNSQYYNPGTSRFSIIKGGQERFSVSADGKVGIGTVSPAYSLDVCGTIRAKEVKIDLDGTCTVPDYVFKEGYQLMGLQELEQFVQTNHHLPEIPSENEMHENGVNLMELQMKLLQKIEELTLYTIELNHQLKNIQGRLSEVEQNN